MFIYNITTKVEHSISDAWLRWQQDIHIPEIMATGLFTEHRFYKLLEHDDEEGAIFVIQFVADSKVNYDTYISEFAPQLREISLVKWNDKTVSFRTLLQNVD